MTLSVVVNEAILTRGTSGSARATTQVSEAMNELPGVVLRGVRPLSARGSSKVRNAFGDAHWDLRQAAAAARGADVLFSPCNIGLASAGQLHLLFVYDVMVWESSDLFDPLFAAYARHLIRFSVKRADRVLTLSAHARDFLVDLVPSANVCVQRLPGRLGPVTPTRAAPGPYTVLMVGETAPHKNQVAGIEAVRRLRARTGADVRLHLVGRPGRGEAQVHGALTAADPDGSWTTRQAGLTDDEVDRAYAGAWVLVQPSVNEGYGLPLVEASQHGLPVVHSGAGAMAEVLPGSSVASTDPEAFDRRLETLLADDVWRRESATVLAQAPRFSWDVFRASVDLHLRELTAQVGDLGRQESLS